MPPEVRSPERTVRRWRDRLLARHQAKPSNEPTEATNNLAKRIKRIGFGLRRFHHHRLRVLLYGGEPNWDRLVIIAPR